LCLSHCDTVERIMKLEEPTENTEQRTLERSAFREN
jgi:hypothetical protein